MSDDISVQSLKDVVNHEVDLAERIEAWAGEISQTYDELVTLHALTFAASANDRAASMQGALESIKEGLEELYKGVHLFRNEGVAYVRSL